jgi:hypothetical protein
MWQCTKVMIANGLKIRFIILSTSVLVVTFECESVTSVNNLPELVDGSLELNCPLTWLVSGDKTMETDNNNNPLVHHQRNELVNENITKLFFNFIIMFIIPLKLNFLHDDEWFHLHRFSLGHIVHTRGFVSAMHLHSLKLYFGDFGFKVHSFWLYIAQALKFQACTHLVRILWRGWIFHGARF